MTAARRSPASVAIASLVTERQWQGQLCQLAEMMGWSWLHVRPLRTQHGWRVPTSGPLAEGWVDLLLVRGARIVGVECKAEGGRLTPSQRTVHELLRPAMEVYTWRPSDLSLAAETLR